MLASAPRRCRAGKWIGSISRHLNLGQPRRTAFLPPDQGQDTPVRRLRGRLSVPHRTRRQRQRCLAHDPDAPRSPALWHQSRGPTRRRIRAGGRGGAGATGGAREGRPVPSRYQRTENGSVSAATIFIAPPQAGHTLASIRNTRARSCAHATRWRRPGPSPSSSAGWAQSCEDAVSELGPGTICDRSRLAGANTP
jgi:hypothetical protein